MEPQYPKIATIILSQRVHVTIALSSIDAIITVNIVNRDSGNKLIILRIWLDTLPVPWSRPFTMPPNQLTAGVSCLHVLQAWPPCLFVIEGHQRARLCQDVFLRRIFCRVGNVLLHVPNRVLLENWCSISLPVVGEWLVDIQ